MKCIFVSGIAVLCSFGYTQVYTYERLNQLGNAVVSGDRFAAISSMNDGETRGNFLHSIRADGSIAWTVPLSQLLPDIACTLDRGPKGGLTIQGFNSKSKTLVISQVNSLGKLLWSREFLSQRARWIQDPCVVDEMGNAMAFHGPDPTITRLDSKGKSVWTYRLGKGEELHGMAPLSDRSYVIVRTGDGAKTIELDAKGRVVKSRNSTAGYLLGIRGEKAFFQTPLKRTSVYDCISLPSRKVPWSPTGPNVGTRKVAIGPNDALSIAWSDNRGQHGIAHFSANGQLEWVKLLSSQLRLDAIRGIGAGQVQALTTPYNSSKVETTLHTFAKGGVEVGKMTAPVKSYSSETQPMIELNNHLYVFSLFGEFNPGETRATGLIGKIWRVGK